jgi:hypothetical protein
VREAAAAVVRARGRLARPRAQPFEVEELVRRPSRVQPGEAADLTAWSGMVSVRAVDRCGRARRAPDENGRLLLDLPASRSPTATSLRRSVRSKYDNLWLSRRPDPAAAGETQRWMGRNGGVGNTVSWAACSGDVAAGRRAMEVDLWRSLTKAEGPSSARRSRGSRPLAR